MKAFLVIFLLAFNSGILLADIPADAKACVLNVSPRAVWGNTFTCDGNAPQSLPTFPYKGNEDENDCDRSISMYAKAFSDKGYRLVNCYAGSGQSCVFVK